MPKSPAQSVQMQCSGCLPYCCNHKSLIEGGVFPASALSSAPFQHVSHPTFFRTKRRTNSSVLPFELPLKGERLIFLPSYSWLVPWWVQEWPGASSEAAQEHHQCELMPLQRASSLFNLAPFQVPKASDGVKPFSCLAASSHLTHHPRVVLSTLALSAFGIR